MGYSVALYSVKLGIFDELIGSKDQTKLDQVWLSVEKNLLYELEVDPSLPYIQEEWQQIGRDYLRQIIFDGKVPDLIESDPTNSFLVRILNTIFESDPLFDTYNGGGATPRSILGETHHWYYGQALKCMKDDGFDDRARQYWEYLCRGRGLGNSNVKSDNYYAYLYLEELEYLVNELYKEPWGSNLRLVDGLFDKGGILDEFEAIIDAKRDLFATAG